MNIGDFIKDLDEIQIYELVLQGKISRFPACFWIGNEGYNRATIIIQHLIERKLHLSEETIKSCLSVSFFTKYKLSGMLYKCFHNSAYEAINSVYPERFKPWEFSNTPMRYWEDVENGIAATKWLIEEKLKLSIYEIKDLLSAKLFAEHGLGTMLQSCFHGSPYEAINCTYPNLFKPWELKNVPTAFWADKNNCILAIKWLVEEKLKLSEKELKEQLSTRMFYDNNLCGMLTNRFNNSAYLAIETAYPNKYKPWEFNTVPQAYWNNRSNRVEAIRWLIEEKLNLSGNEKHHVTYANFKKYGLSGMICNCYCNSIKKALNEAYKST